MFSLYFDLMLFVILVISHFGFEGRTLIMIASVSGHCLPFTFQTMQAYMYTDIPRMSQPVVKHPVYLHVHVYISYISVF